MYDARADAVTGLLSPRELAHRVEREVAQRQDNPVSLITCELDGFAAVIEDADHEQVDTLLQTAARAILSALPKDAAVGYLGRGRFAVLLAPADELEALEAAERVRVGVRGGLAGSVEADTVSCGASTLGAADGELFKAALGALAEARRRGGDQTVAAAANGNGPERRVVFPV